MYFAVELFGLIITNDEVLPTGIPARPVKLTVLFADELAVNTTSGCATLIVVLAPIKLVTLAVSNTVLRKLVAPDKLTLDVVTVDAKLLEVTEPVPILSPVTAPAASSEVLIEPSAIAAVVIALAAMSAPVIVLFAISANVISPLAISADEITFDVILAAVIFESAIFLLFYWLFTLFS
jgi:hypothetical protein